MSLKYFFTRLSTLFIFCYVINLSGQENDLLKYHIYYSIGEYNNAIAVLQDKLTADSLNPTFNYYLGKTEIALKKPFLALKTLSNVLITKPDDFKTHSLMGKAYESVNLHADAVNAYLKAIKIVPNDKSSFEKLCFLYF